MNAPDSAARAANGANGLQIYTNVNDAPLDEARFLPVFEVAANVNRPILLRSRFCKPPEISRGNEMEN